MTDPLWTGVAAALVTLFDDDNAIDERATATHAARLADEGVRAVLVGGSTGEADTLTDAELAGLTAAVRAALPSSVPVITGASGAWRDAAAARIAAAVGAGADAVLVAPPRRPGDLHAYYEAAAKAAGNAPVLAYHFPGTAGGDVPVPALPDLPIAGLKDSTGSAERLLQELAVWDRAVYVGSSALVLMAGAVGAAGAILAVANTHPAESVAAFAGDATAQRALLEPHLRSKERFPAGLKSLVAERYGTSTSTRLG
ncbi:4-hydroxy-tetrahydrodipicolinate synthase [Asanoa ishikariensis]|uniref:4-hydroxy-tetrahydrodipicolinate synthase n=1 Tax=Asanoa ishikariensis TaxID=137265 RepID=A0A1H3QPG4_9ACTN|nr:dihydrodipicolinate synthase family protein [Asanoa ishikariensis]SDZ15472.1 4-hydroxy-tetrahydrodipicolinate synthase [Asanoa ishikariensis]